MAQHPIELILLKRWATYIAVPIGIMDAEAQSGLLQRAGRVRVGGGFDEVGEVDAADLAERFETRGLDGEPLENKELPIVIA